MKYYCKNCGKEFIDYPSRKRKFCSQSCNMIYQNKINPNLRYSGNTKNKFKITNQVKEYIDGLILGDASIQFPETKSKRSTRLVQTFSKKYDDWAKEIKNDLSMFDIDSHLTYYSIFDKRTEKTYKQISLQTKVYPQFMIFRKRWYPNNIKQVPDDIILSPTVLRNWYLSDGSLRVINKNSRTIQLSTDSFNEESINLLIKLLFQIKFTPKSSNSRIYIYKNKEAIKMINIIKNFPKSMSHKGVVGV